MRVLGIGESVIDNVILTHKEMGDAAVVKERHVGGPIPAALVLLSRLGISCTLMTSLGEDREATIIKKTLKKEHVHVIVRQQTKTKVHTVLVNSQTGQREKQRGEIIHQPIKRISRNFLAQFDCILIDRHEKEAFFEVLAKKRENTTLIVDTSTEVSPDTLDMLKHATFPILPIEAVAKIDKKKNLLVSLKSLQKHCNKPIIVTIGELGSIFFDNGKITVAPSLSIKTVDTTGAGDIFRGAFTFGILQRWNIEETIQFANLVAGLQCTKIGNIAAIPTKEEIQLCKNLVIQKKPVNKTRVNNYFLHLL